jgi:hypothetical protein
MSIHLHNGKETTVYVIVPRCAVLEHINIPPTPRLREFIDDKKLFEK